MGINYPSKIDDRKTFEENNPAIALNIFYTKENKKKYVQLISQKLIQILKTNSSINDSKRRKKKDNIILQQNKCLRN